MKELCTANLAELKTLLDEGAVTSVDIVRALKAAYQADEKQTTPLHGFIEFFDDAEVLAEKADALRKEGKTAGKPLLGLPFAVKDNISMQGKLCTCCSKILEGYKAPYNATVITRLTEAGAIPIGRTNMDEFAMGSSTEYSVYGPSHNPVDRTLTPGGSSGGSDPHDETSVPHDFSSCAHLEPYTDGELRKLRIALPVEFMQAKGLDGEVAALFEKFRNRFTSKGIQVDSVSIPVLESAIAMYYVIALSEASSNLARFDGIRYGLREDPGKGYDELYCATRSAGFGREVKRRIITGNYVLSHHLSGDCYESALRVRARMEKEVGAVLQQYDFIFCPTAPTPAFKLGERVDDPLAMYLSDLFTTFVNLSHIPALSIPAGKAKDGRPVGMQIAGAKLSEEKILRLAKTLEAARV